tara:strand:+ start:629 stop:1117 length:489 start_codon:yes stop_codon:yes gene_type:complete
MDLVNVIVLLNGAIVGVHSFKLEDVNQAEEVFREKVTENGGKDDIEHYLEEGNYEAGDLCVCIVHSRVATTTDPRVADILAIKEAVKQHGTIPSSFVKERDVIHSSFGEGSNKVVTEISNEGVSITDCYEGVEGDTEFCSFSELSTPLLAELRNVADSFAFD